MDGTETLMLPCTPTALRPLLGETVLLVEDSRFASEAVRLLCLRSGARLRRADCVTTAWRHLAVYRPSILLVDLGLPDGCGLELIATLSRARLRIPVILGISGDEAAGDSVLLNGADGFLAKPVDSLAAFQAAILRHLPPARRPPALRLVADDIVTPDRIAYRDDLAQIARLLRQDDADSALNYITQFLDSVACSAHDPELDRIIAVLQQSRAAGIRGKPQVAALAQLLQQRLAQAAPIYG